MPQVLSPTSVSTLPCPKPLARQVSEPVPERELEVALRIGVPVRRRRDAPGVGIVVARHADLRIRVAQIDVIQEVHGLDPELELLIVDHPEFLEQ